MMTNFTIFSAFLIANGVCLAVMHFLDLVSNNLLSRFIYSMSQKVLTTNIKNKTLPTKIPRSLTYQDDLIPIFIVI